MNPAEETNSKGIGFAAALDSYNRLTFAALEFPLEPSMQWGPLNNLMAQIFCSILDEAIDKLKILQKIDCASSACDIDLNYRSLEDRFGNSDFEDILGKTDAEHNCEKLAKDRLFLLTILEITADNLRKEGSFDRLREILDDEWRKKNDEKHMVESMRENIRKFRLLKKAKTIERENHTKAIQELMRKAGNLKDEIKDRHLEHDIKCAFVAKWENSRNEQNQHILTEKEYNLSNLSRQYNLEITKEVRIHQEIVNFLTEMTSDHQMDIQLWMNTYDSDIEERDNQNQSLRISLEVQKDRYLQLKESFEQRQEEMSAYLEHKERKNQERLAQERLNKAATRIQAWWRGVMFRRGLGQYRKKLKGKKGGSGEKGKGGKKGGSGEKGKGKKNK